MAATSRRAFLGQATLGVAGLGAVAVVPKRFRAPAHPSTEAGVGGEPAVLEGDLVAHLRDPLRGEFSLMVGEREVIFTDKALAARLTHAAK